MEFEQLVHLRRSVKRFDASVVIPDKDIETMLALATASPSSFNLQHWRFVVVREEAGKARLCKAGFGQEQLKTASITIVIAGKLNAHEDADRLYANTPANVREVLLPMIAGFYADKPEMQRDEAIRSASLAAMTLMYAAGDLGYSTCPMIGFDPKAVSDIVGLPADHIPAMLVVVGKEVGEGRPSPRRLPISEVATFETINGPGVG